MPNKIGSLEADVNLNLRPALQQWNRFQQTVRQGRGRDSIFGSISSDAREFDSSLGKATNRVVAFGAAAAIFTGLARATRAFADSIIEVDKNLAAINVNLNQSTEGLKKFGADLFNVARQTGSTFEAAAAAAAELARQGLGAEETTKRLKDSLILSRIAGLDSAAAVETLTAALNSFNKEVLTSNEVVNKFAAVDTKFAVSSKDLAEAVSRVGSTAQAAGVGIDQLIGLVTSLQQTTARGGSVIGNGLRTIFTRIQASPETVSALEGIGVAIKNTDGSLRDAVSILKDYAVARNRVGEAERAALDNTVAGQRQINILKALLGDLTKQYGIYGNALSTSVNATDEAIRKNEQLNQTISSLLNSTSVSIKQLFSNIGSQNLGPVFQGLLKNLESVRQFFSGDSGSDIGQTLGNGIVKGLSNVLTGPAFFAIAIVLVNAFKKVITTIAQEARTLLTINSASEARARIQKQINTLLTQATEAERAQYLAATSVLAKKEQILAIQARINQEELAGTPIQRSFQVGGGLFGYGAGVDKRLKRSSGYIGNFADPLGEAIGRERAAGVPAKDIYVDRDPRVANFANPLGLLVANRRDEPLGGFQGVNRVISSGGNPRAAGAGGVSNFAAPFSQTALRTSTGQFVAGSQIDAINRLVLSLKNLDTSRIKVAATELTELSKGLNATSRNLVQLRVASALSAAARRSGKIFYQGGTPGREIESLPDLEQRQFSGDEGYAEAFLRSSAGASTYNRPIGPSYRAFENYQDTQYRARQERLARAIKRGSDRRKAKLAEVEQIRQRNQNRALGAAFILPFASGFIEPTAQSLGFKTGGGTAGGITTGALGGAAQGAGIGGIFGPAGLGIGAAIGALIGAFGKLKKSTEEYATETENAVAARNSERDAITRYITLQEELNDAIKEGANPDVLRRLNTGLSEARGGIISPRAATAIAEKDPTKRADLLAANDRSVAQQNTRDTISLGIRRGQLPRARDFQSGFTPEFTSSLSLAQKQTLGRAADTKFDITPTFNVKTGEGNLIEAKAAQDAFKKSLEEVTPILKDFVDISTITPQNLNEIAKNFRTALNSFKAIENALGPTKAALLDRLPKNAFVNAPNLDIYRQAALTGRNPRASQASRAQADFAFYQELISSGVLKDEKTLESDPGYQKAKAGTQRDNALRAAAALLQANNPSVGRLTNSLGDYSGTAIERQLGFLANAGVRNSGKAKLALDFVQRSAKTASDAGFSDTSYSENFRPSESGIVPGTKYSVTAGDSLRAAQETVQKTLQSVNATIIRTALQVDGTIKVMSDVKSSEELKQLASELTAAIGRQFQAQITDLNVRLSKAEGKPLPPTSVSNDTAFGNKMIKGSDGFIRTAPVSQ